MNEQQALEYIHSMHRFGRNPGLERIRRLMDRLGNPERKLKFIHIAGTNGKGSVTTMTAAVLREAGYRVGQYTSPYVINFRERIQINGKMISPQDLADCVELVRAAASDMTGEEEAPREFEVVTAVALVYFAREKCDYVAFEVGLGGRFDATNVIPAPLCAAIVPIGLDHTQFLGSTHAEIAFEKCGILKKGSYAVTTPWQNPEAMEVIRRRAQEEQIPLLVPEKGELISRSLSGTRFRWRGEEYLVTLAGSYQLENATIVMGILDCLRKQGVEIPETAVKEGLKKAFIPARLEILQQKDPLILLDGAHNPHGTAALRETILELNPGRLVGITGMMADKNCREALEYVVPLLSELITVAPKIPRALPAPELAEIAGEFCGKVTPAESCEQALRMAKQSNPDTILIFGSLYLAGEMRPLFKPET